MSYFFRKSFSFGPIRLNLSKSGVGASVGVSGARLTMTPHGTSYITVGSHGFYYRETFSQRRGGQASNPTSPTAVPAAPPAGEIVTADVSDLVDSSSEKLIERLNERARMSNPAWFFYAIAVAMSIAGLAIFSTPWNLPDSTPPLPEVTSPFSAERIRNTTDEYPVLIARYGEPESVLSTEPLGIVAVGTAHYSPANVNVVLVPNGCVEAYDEAMRSLAEGSRNSAANRKMRSIKRCVPETDAGWTIVGYRFSADNVAISPDAAKVLLDKSMVRRTSPPRVDSESSQAVKQKSGPRGLAPRQTRPLPALQSDQRARVLEEQMKQGAEQISQNAEATKRRQQYSGSALLLGSLGVFLVGFVAHKKNTEKRTSRLFYELDETERQKYSIIQQTLTHLSSSQRIWRVEAESATPDWKRNAGASTVVRRVPISVGRSNPPRVETNLEIPCVNLGRKRLFFLPDVILYWEAGTYGAIAYDDFRVEQSFTRFIEDGDVPGDSTVVDRTWRYVNKNGGPDRRFNNNVQLPVLQYGVLVLASSGGLNIHLNTSNAQASLAVANCWRELRGRTGCSREPQSAAQIRANTPSGPRVQAFKVLGLNATASADEISAAYRHLAQMYHPDKVVGLAPEFQTLADTRMKEINAAYEILAPRSNR
jgi:hypothetical protein